MTYTIQRLGKLAGVSVRTLHYNALRNFYELNVKIYRGLAEMYVGDPRFTAFYENYAAGLAQFMHDVMLFYVEAAEK